MCKYRIKPPIHVYRLIGKSSVHRLFCIILTPWYERYERYKIIFQHLTHDYRFIRIPLHIFYGLEWPSYSIFHIPNIFAMYSIFYIIKYIVFDFLGILVFQVSRYVFSLNITFYDIDLICFFHCIIYF